MSEDIMALVTGEVVSDDQIVSLIQLCKCCDLAVEHLLPMVEQGIVEPLEFNTSHIHWQFIASSVLRVQTALRLQRDLDVNLAGAALALDLLDEIKILRRFKNLDE